MKIRKRKYQATVKAANLNERLIGQMGCITARGFQTQDDARRWADIVCEENRNAAINTHLEVADYNEDPPAD